MRPKIFRTVLILALLEKGYALVWCAANAAQCNAFYNDLGWNQPLEGSYSGPGMEILHPKF